jgi:hypothetical protein
MLMLMMMGIAGLTVNGYAVEVPPAVTTVMFADPKGIRLAGTAAVTWVELT